MGVYPPIGSTEYSRMYNAPSSATSSDRNSLQKSEKNRSDHAPQPLTGGCGNTESPEYREISEISHPVATTGYDLRACGLDSVQEAYCAQLRANIVERLEKAKADALERDPSGKTGVIVNIAGYEVEVRGHGATGGITWVVGTGSWLCLFAKNRDWGVNVRYLADGLWLRGLEDVRQEVTAFLHETCVFAEDVKPGHSLTRADFCFDIYSPDFTAAMRPGIIDDFCFHSSSKRKADGKVDPYHYQEIGRGKRLETITIGSKRGLQVQVYDKTTEITEASGKTYMYDRWADKETGEVPEADMWRVELRFGRDFLKNRNIRTLDEFLNVLDELKTEALHKIRLTENNGDTNQARRPYHPLWSVCVQKFATYRLLPLGRIVDGQRAALKEQAVKQIAGTLRSATVLAKDGVFDEDMVSELMDEAIAELFKDKKHREKCAIARVRYRYVKGRALDAQRCDEL